MSPLVFLKLKFQPNAYNRCHDLLMMSINFSNIAILNIKVSDYCCIISLISKKEVINLMQNVENCKFEKKKTYKIFWKYIKKWKKYIYIKFGDIEIQEQKFHQHKEPVPIKIWILIK